MFTTAATIFLEMSRSRKPLIDSTGIWVRPNNVPGGVRQQIPTVKTHSFQIAVFTCRPSDYLLPSALVPQGSAVYAGAERSKRLFGKHFMKG